MGKRDRKMSEGKDREGGTTILRNVGNCLVVNMTKHPRKFQSSCQALPLPLFTHFPSLTRVTCPADLIFLDIITLTVFYEEDGRIMNLFVQLLII